MIRLCLHLVLLLAVLRPVTVSAHGSVHERLAAVERQLAESPRNASLLLQRAMLHHEHGNHDKALEDLRAVGRIEPILPERWLLEAEIQLARNEPALALEAVRHLLEIDPRSVAGLSLHSRILEKTGRIGEAVARARKVIEVAPEPMVDYHLWLIRLLDRQGNRDVVAAAFTAARTSCGDFPVLLRRQAEWLADGGEREAAAEVYAELREKVPGLAFGLHVEEAKMWHGHDADRARIARDAAHRAWNSLSSGIRSRDAMRKKHHELLKLGDSTAP